MGRVYLHNDWLTGLLAVQCILLVFRVQVGWAAGTRLLANRSQSRPGTLWLNPLLVPLRQYYTQAFRGTRFAFLTIIRDVWVDLRPYFYFM